MRRQTPRSRRIGILTLSFALLYGQGTLTPHAFAQQAGFREAHPQEPPL